MHNISVCLIGKNEAHILERCLQALAPYPWEIVFTDTGSTDETKAIAKKYTNNVYDFAWIDDFSAARNFCAQKASNDWILALDCDEILDPFDYEALIKKCAVSVSLIGHIHLRNLNINEETSEEAYYYGDIPRLYNKILFQFKHRIHEQLLPLCGHSTPCYFKTNLSVLHVGYALSSDIINKKRERNISLLETQLANCSDPVMIPYTLYQLGLSYKAIDKNKALQYFLQAFEYDIEPTTAYYPLLVVKTGETYQELGQIEQGYRFLIQHKDKITDFADFYYTLGFFVHASGDTHGAIDCYKKALTATQFNNELAHSSGSHYNIGLLYTLNGRIQEAIKHLEMCIEFKDTKQKLGLIYYQIGQQLYNEEKYTEAYPLLKKASQYLKSDGI